MKTQSEHLSQILKCEAMQANWGVKANKLKKEYAKCFGEFKKGDRVKITDSSGKEKIGIVRDSRFDVHNFITYLVDIWVKDFKKKAERIHPVWVAPNVEGFKYVKIEIV